MPKSKRKIVILECPVCRAQNYITEKNPQTAPKVLQLNKFCRHCRKYTPHKEIK